MLLLLTLLDLQNFNTYYFKEVGGVAFNYNQFYTPVSKTVGPKSLLGQVQLAETYYDGIFGRLQLPDKSLTTFVVGLRIEKRHLNQHVFI